MAENKLIYPEGWLFLTTLDNPFNPATEHDFWLEYDRDHGYNTVNLNARYFYSSDGHLSDFGSVYQGEWLSLLDFFRICLPSDAGWTNLTGTDTALQRDAIAMYQNDSLGIVIIIYYGFQPYRTTEGIYQALSGNPDYARTEYVRCNGLMAVGFEHGNSEKSLAFADAGGGIVQITVQCSDASLRALYSEQLFSALLFIRHTKLGKNFRNFKIF